MNGIRSFFWMLDDTNIARLVVRYISFLARVDTSSMTCDLRTSWAEAQASH
jgi:hypothetical protein